MISSYLIPLMLKLIINVPNKNQGILNLSQKKIHQKNHDNQDITNSKLNFQ